MLLNILQCTGQPPSTNYPAPNADSAEVGNSILVSYKDEQTLSYKSL